MYLLKSDRIPQRILCLCPWVNFVIVLRDPISRAFSQYNIRLSYEKDKIDVTFDQWVRHDYEGLRSLGILRDFRSQEEFEQFSGSAEELEAWKIYSKLDQGLNAPVGRGLYSIQLRHWFQAYAAQNRTLNLLAIKSDDLKIDVNASYRRVLDHLDLPKVPLNSYEMKYAGGYKSDRMSTETQHFLQKIFEPYNCQLAGLLGKEWEGVWS